MKSKIDKQLLHSNGLEKFETVCCLRGEIACQRLDTKHHRTNTRCWVHPNICYHCSVVAASKDHRWGDSQLNSGQAEETRSDEQTSSLTTNDAPDHSHLVTGRSLQANEERSHLVSDCIDDWESDYASTKFGNSGSPSMKGVILMVDLKHENVSEGPCLFSSTGCVINSIEESELEESKPLQEGCFDHGRNRRSRAPSPEMCCKGSIFSHNLAPDCFGYENGSSIRDFRYELSFLMSLQLK